ncbi:MAG: histidine kinase [Nevskia sp.]|nr:histidine kinase [Nevskia sp.]
MNVSAIAADIEAVARIGAIPSILEMVCKSTGLRFAAVARVTQDNWTACAVRDEIEFGLKVGGELPVKTTICDEIRDSHSVVVIDHVSEDVRYCKHHTPRIYGFQSYISYPIKRKSGEFFGTLCALDPRPTKLSDPQILKTFELFSELIGLQLDVEDRLKQTQQALSDELKTAELREQFIAVLGHDLRNPLFAVTAGAEALLKMSLPEKAKAVVQRIERSGARMTQLVDNILDFARGRLSGGLPIEKRIDNTLAYSVSHVVDELRSTHPGRQIELHVDLPRAVSCDSARIGQLLSNLVSNALHHGAPDGPIYVKAHCDEQQFKLAVTNEGRPIPSEISERLFQPFYRASNSERSESLGLGLYIAAQIAQSHGGALTVESNSDATTFQLAMPVNAQ